MKKIVFVALLLVGLTVNAQEKSQFEKDTYKLVEMISKPTFNSVVGQMAAMVKTENVEAFTKEVEATYPELFTAMTKIYMEEMTHNDIKAIVAFYATPAGKKLLEKQPVLQQKGMQAGQAWGMKLQGLVGKYQ